MENEKCSMHDEEMVEGKCSKCSVGEATTEETPAE